MGIGHVAVGLGLKRADREINVGWLIFAALLADFLLGWFVLAGWESYEVPAGYTSGHYLLFTFPWSHGLAADTVWAATAGLVALAVTRRRRAAVVVAIAVASHFVLDGIVHVKGLPLAASGGPVFGLGLWRRLPLELSLEAGMAAAGLLVYLATVRDRSPGRRAWMAVYTVVLAVFMIAGQASATGAPPRGGLIASWLVAPVVFSAIAFGLDRRRRVS
jgi:hypothetical protein